MAENIITLGIGSSPGSVKPFILFGLDVGAAIGAICAYSAGSRAYAFTGDSRDFAFSSDSRAYSFAGRSRTYSFTALERCDAT